MGCRERMVNGRHGTGGRVTLEHGKVHHPHELELALRDEVEASSELLTDAVERGGRHDIRRGNEYAKIAFEQTETLGRAIGQELGAPALQPGRGALQYDE